VEWGNGRVEERRGGGEKRGVVSERKFRGRREEWSKSGKGEEKGKGTGVVGAECGGVRGWRERVGVGEGYIGGDGSVGE